MVLPAQLYGFAEALGELNARRTTRNVSFDFLTRFRR